VKHDLLIFARPHALNNAEMGRFSAQSLDYIMPADYKCSTTPDGACTFPIIGIIVL